MDQEAKLNQKKKELTFDQLEEVSGGGGREVVVYRCSKCETFHTTNKKRFESHVAQCKGKGVSLLELFPDS